MNTKTKDLDIKTLFSILLHNLKYIIAAIILGVILAIVITKVFIDPKYNSSVSIYVNNSNEVNTNANLNINDITASQKLVDTCIVILTNDEILTKVSESLLEKYSTDELDDYLGLANINGKMMPSPASIRKTIAMASVNQTQILKIDVLTKNPKLSNDICTTLATFAPDTLKQIVKVGSAEQIAVPTLNNTPASPSVVKNATIGALLAAVITILIIILRFVLDTTIKTSDDIKDNFDLAVLGEVPDLSLT
ncbi:MAG: Wzz/FepE/Etk N-terminal domain-containing protein [Oscillospiraceae bacterium]